MAAYQGLGTASRTLRDALHRRSRTLLAENLGKPSLWVFINVPWYKPRPEPMQPIGDMGPGTESLETVADFGETIDSGMKVLQVQEKAGRGPARERAWA